VLLVCAAPLAGLALAGRPVAPFLGFPPRTVYIAHAGFSWIAFALFSLPALAVVAGFLYVARTPAREPAHAENRWPRWGWIGVVLIAFGWTLAWREGLVPPDWRQHTFTVLWAGYIVAMNAAAYRRSGRSPLTHRTAWFLSLFPASALFWWLFEYLNQFSGNWYYAGITPDNASEYFIQASVPFSTVLPAVASTRAWLATFPRFQHAELTRMRGNQSFAWLSLLAGGVGLVMLPLWPDELFSMLWLAPLLVFAGLQSLVVKESLFAPLAQGDWRPVLQPAAAATVCGLCWELWNYGSLARWHYSIPYVDRFHVFEMPLLGYAGYLPFGIECGLVLQLVARLQPNAAAEQELT